MLYLAGAASYSALEYKSISFPVPTSVYVSAEKQYAVPKSSEHIHLPYSFRYI